MTASAGSGGRRQRLTAPSSTTPPAPLNYQGDASSPAGIYVESVGFLHVLETDGTTSRFLIFPSIGLVQASVPTVPVVGSPTAEVNYTAHLINVKTTTRSSQNFMRSLGDNTSPVTTKLYAALPDVFDFLVLCSTDKVERPPTTRSRTSSPASTCRPAATSPARRGACSTATRPLAAPASF
jgi:hypothetical protein